MEEPIKIRWVLGAGGRTNLQEQVRAKGPETPCDKPSPFPPFVKISQWRKKSTLWEFNF